MKSERPGSVLTIAILHLVGGGLGLVLVICGGIGLAMQSSLTKAMTSANPQHFSVRMQARMAHQIPSATAVQIGELLASFVLSVLLITAGIGLLSMRNWARYLSFIYAGLSIVNKLFSFAFFLF